MVPSFLLTADEKRAALAEGRITPKLEESAKARAMALEDTGLALLVAEGAIRLVAYHARWDVDDKAHDGTLAFTVHGLDPDEQLELFLVEFAVAAYEMRLEAAKTKAHERERLWRSPALAYHLEYERAVAHAKAIEHKDGVPVTPFPGSPTGNRLWPDAPPKGDVPPPVDSLSGTYAGNPCLACGGSSFDCIAVPARTREGPRRERCSTCGVWRRVYPRPEGDADRPPTVGEWIDAVCVCDGKPSGLHAKTCPAWGLPANAEEARAQIEAARAKKKGLQGFELPPQAHVSWYDPNNPERLAIEKALADGTLKPPTEEEWRQVAADDERRRQAADPDYALCSHCGHEWYKHQPASAGCLATTCSCPGYVPPHRVLRAEFRHQSGLFEMPRRWTLQLEMPLRKGHEAEDRSYFDALSAQLLKIDSASAVVSSVDVQASAQTKEGT